MEKTISIYFNNFVKSALERENLYFRSLNVEGERAAMNKNVEFILKKFIKKYKNNLVGIEELITSSLNSNLSDIGRTELNNKIEHKETPYPISMDIKTIDELEELRNDINIELGVKFNKIFFFNFIMLNYYISNKENILKKELEFWNQDYLKKGNQ